MKDTKKPIGVSREHFLNESAIIPATKYTKHSFLAFHHSGGQNNLRCFLWQVITPINHNLTHQEIP